MFFLSTYKNLIMVFVTRKPYCFKKGDDRMLVKFNRDPFTRINRLFDDVWTSSTPSNAFTSPELSGAFRSDISEDEKAIYIEAELPGVKKEEIKLNLDDDVLTVSGERKQETEEKKVNYHRVERIFGNFSRSFRLGDNIDKENIEATYDNGVLKLMLPKLEMPKSSKQIEVK